MTPDERWARIEEQLRARGLTPEHPTWQRIAQQFSAVDAGGAPQREGSLARHLRAFRYGLQGGTLPLLLGMRDEYVPESIPERIAHGLGTVATSPELALMAALGGGAAVGAGALGRYALLRTSPVLAAKVYRAGQALRPFVSSAAALGTHSAAQSALRGEGDWREEGARGAAVGLLAAGAGQLLRRTGMTRYRKALGDAGQWKTAEELAKGVRQVKGVERMLRRRQLAGEIAGLSFGGRALGEIGQEGDLVERLKRIAAGGVEDLLVNAGIVGAMHLGREAGNRAAGRLIRRLTEAELRRARAVPPPPQEPPPETAPKASVETPPKAPPETPPMEIVGEPPPPIVEKAAAARRVVPDPAFVTREAARHVSDIERARAALDAARQRVERTKRPETEQEVPEWNAAVQDMQAAVRAYTQALHAAQAFASLYERPVTQQGPKPEPLAGQVLKPAPPTQQGPKPEPLAGQVLPPPSSEKVPVGFRFAVPPNEVSGEPLSSAENAPVSPGKRLSSQQVVESLAAQLRQQTARVRMAKDRAEQAIAHFEALREKTPPGQTNPELERAARTAAQVASEYRRAVQDATEIGQFIRNTLEKQSGFFVPAPKRGKASAAKKATGEPIPPQAVPPEAVPPEAVPPQAVPPQAVPPEAVPPQAVPQEPVPVSSAPVPAPPEAVAPPKVAPPPQAPPAPEAVRPPTQEPMMTPEQVAHVRPRTEAELVQAGAPPPAEPFADVMRLIERVQGAQTAEQQATARRALRRAAAKVQREIARQSEVIAGARASLEEVVAEVGPPASWSPEVTARVEPVVGMMTQVERELALLQRRHAALLALEREGPAAARALLSEVSQQAPRSIESDRGSAVPPAVPPGEAVVPAEAPRAQPEAKPSAPSVAPEGARVPEPMARIEGPPRVERTEKGERPLAVGGVESEAPERPVRTAAAYERLSIPNPAQKAIEVAEPILRHLKEIDDPFIEQTREFFRGVVQAAARELEQPKPEAGHAPAQERKPLAVPMESIARRAELEADRVLAYLRAPQAVRSVITGERMGALLTRHPKDVLALFPQLTTTPLRQGMLLLYNVVDEPRVTALLQKGRIHEITRSPSVLETEGVGPSVPLFQQRKLERRVPRSVFPPLAVEAEVGTPTREPSPFFRRLLSGRGKPTARGPEVESLGAIRPEDWFVAAKGVGLDPIRLLEEGAVVPVERAGGEVMIQATPRFIRLARTPLGRKLLAALPFAEAVEKYPAALAEERLARAARPKQAAERFQRALRETKFDLTVSPVLEVRGAKEPKYVVSVYDPMIRRAGRIEFGPQGVQVYGGARPVESPVWRQIERLATKAMPKAEVHWNPERPAMQPPELPPRPTRIAVEPPREIVATVEAAREAPVKRIGSPERPAMPEGKGETRPTPEEAVKAREKSPEVLQAGPLDPTNARAVEAASREQAMKQRLMALSELVKRQDPGAFDLLGIDNNDRLYLVNKSADTIVRVGSGTPPEIEVLGARKDWTVIRKKLKKSNIDVTVLKPKKKSDTTLRATLVPGLVELTKLVRSAWQFVSGKNRRVVLTDPVDNQVFHEQAIPKGITQELSEWTQKRFDNMRKYIREFRYLKSIEQWPEVREGLRKLEDLPITAAERALVDLTDYVARPLAGGKRHIDPYDAQLFNAFIYVRMQEEAARLGLPTVSGHDRAFYRQEAKRLYKMMPHYVREAVVNHARLWRKVLEADIKYGFLPKEVRAKPFYAPFSAVYPENQPYAQAARSRGIFVEPSQRRLRETRGLTARPDVDYFRVNLSALTTAYVAHGYRDFVQRYLRKVDRMPVEWKFPELKSSVMSKVEPEVRKRMQEVAQNQPLSEGELLTLFGRTATGEVRRPQRGMLEDGARWVLIDEKTKKPIPFRVMHDAHTRIKFNVEMPDPFLAGILDFVSRATLATPSEWSAKDPMRAVRGIERFLVPEEVYFALRDIQVGRDVSMASELIRKLMVGWKRAMVLESGLPFSTLNLMGDATTLFYADSLAFGEMIRYDPIVAREIAVGRAKKAGPRAYNEERGVLPNLVWLTLMGVKGRPGTRLGRFQQFLQDELVIGSGTVIYGPQVMRASIQRMLQTREMSPTAKFATELLHTIGAPLHMLDWINVKREHIPRLALAARVFYQLEHGQTPRSPFIDTRGLSPREAAGKIARETLGDLGAVSPAFQRLFRDGLAPFVYWYGHQAVILERLISQRHLPGPSIFGFNVTPQAWLNRASALAKFVLLRAAPFYYTHVLGAEAASQLPEWARKQLMVIVPKDEDEKQVADGIVPPKSFYFLPTGDDWLLGALGINEAVYWVMQWRAGNITDQELRDRVLSVGGMASLLQNGMVNTFEGAVPLAGAVSQLLRNRTRGGEMIYDPNDPPEVQQQQIAAFLLLEALTINRLKGQASMAERMYPDSILFPGIMGSVLAHWYRRAFNPNMAEHLRYQYRPELGTMYWYIERAGRGMQKEHEVVKLVDSVIIDQLAKGPKQWALDEVTTNRLVEANTRIAKQAPWLLHDESDEELMVEVPLTGQNNPVDLITEIIRHVPMAAGRKLVERYMRPSMLRYLFGEAARRTEDDAWRAQLLRMRDEPLALWETTSRFQDRYRREHQVYAAGAKIVAKQQAEERKKRGEGLIRGIARVARGEDAIY